MTSLRAILAFNMKEQRNVLGISQSKLAEKVHTSTHYIGMIENEKKFPTPEMLERIAAALEIDAPNLFSKKNYPLADVDDEKTMSKFHQIIIKDISQIISKRIKEFGNDISTT